MVKVTDNREETSGKRVVCLTVIPLPADKTKVGGNVKMYDPDPDHTISARRDGATVEIGQAWKLALKMAEDGKADFILVDDPKKLFPREKWPRNGNILDDPDILSNPDILK